MADTHFQGPVYNADRYGSVNGRQSFVVSGNTSTTATPFLYVQASATAPVVVEAQVAVTTADGGSSPTISVGYTASGYTDLINVASTATAATGGTFLPASNNKGKKYLTSDTLLYFKQGGTPDGAGVTTILLDLSTVNTSTVTGL